eukprot:COSAG01_NODE_222_length_21420_cov_30.616763_8_plen_357_part_00
MDAGGRNFGAFKLHRHAPSVADGRATFSTGPGCAGCQPCKTPLGVRNWQVKPNEYYNMTLFTSMPRTARLKWYHHGSNDAILLTIFMTQPFAIDVFLGRRKVPDALNVGVTQNRLPTLSDGHGAHALDPHARLFYLVVRGQDTRRWKGDNTLSLFASMVVQLDMVVAVKVEEFDGPQFVENIARLLQIPRYRIKIVSVQGRTSGTPDTSTSGRRLQGAQPSSEVTEVITHVVEDVSPAEQDAAIAYAEWAEDSGLDTVASRDKITVPAMGSNNKVRCGPSAPTAWRSVAVDEGFAPLAYKGKTSIEQCKSYCAYDPECGAIAIGTWRRAGDNKCYTKRETGAANVSKLFSHHSAST